MLTSGELGLSYQFVCRGFSSSYDRSQKRPSSEERAIYTVWVLASYD